MASSLVMRQEHRKQDSKSGKDLEYEGPGE